MKIEAVRGRLLFVILLFMPAPTPQLLDFELLFAALPAPYAALAPDGTILALNNAMAALLGPVAALTGQPLVALPAALAAVDNRVAPPATWAGGLLAAQAGTRQVLAPEWADEQPLAGASAPTYWEATLHPVPASDSTTSALRYVLVHLLDVSQQPRMQRILDQLPLTITTMEGPDLTFTFLSATARQKMGPRTQMGRPAAECLPEIAAQGYLEVLRQVLATGQPVVGHEERSLLLDPATGVLREHYNNFGYLPLLDAGSTPTGVLAYSLDVTEQVQARLRSEALAAENQRQQEQFRLLTEFIPQLVFRADATGRSTYVNQRWRDYTGCPTEQPGPEHLGATIIHPDDFAAAAAAWQTAAAEGSYYELEYRLRRHDGEYRWFLTQVQPLRDATGQVTEWFGTCTDVHEQRQIRAQLQQQDQRMHRILDELPLVLGVYEGPELRPSVVLPKMQRLMGSRLQLGRPRHEIMPEMNEQGHGQETMLRVYETGEAFHALEQAITFTDSDTGESRLFYFNTGMLPLRAADDQPVSAVLSYGIDVTEQVLARQRAEALQATAQAADQRLRHVTESQPSITFISDEYGNVLYISPQWHEYTGSDPAEPLDEVWQRSLHPEDQLRVQVAYAQALAVGGPWRYEFRLRRHDGQYRWFTSQGVPEPLAEAQAADRPRQWFGTNLDIHELREAQRQLELKDQQLTQILTQSPTLIATTTGPEHRFAYTNPGFDALLGQRARLGERLGDCAPEVVEQSFGALLDQVYRTGETFVGQEVPLELYDSATGQFETAHLNLTCQGRRDDESQIIGLMVFIVDVTEQVRARREADVLQAEVQAADARLRRQAEALPIITFITDGQGETLYVSPQWYQYTGQAAGGPWAEVDAHWREALHPDDRPKALRLIQLSIELAQNGRMEVRLRGADGQYRWFLTEAVPELDATGRLVRRYGYLLDVHELRERTHELARSREDFAALADNIAQLAWMADATGSLFWYNQQWYEYTGSSAEEMQGWGWMKVHDPALVEGVNERYLECIAAGQPWEDTFPLRRHDGQFRWFLSRARPIRDAATGAVVRWCGTNTDVTELRQLQTQLGASEEELRIQAESIPQQVWTALPDGTVDFFNHRTAAYVGESMEKNGAVNWLSFVHPDDRADMQANWAQAIASQRYYEAEFRLRRYDGQYRWFLGQAQARRANGGQVLKWYGTNTDVHQQRVLQEQLLTSQARFQQLIETLPQMAWTANPDGATSYYNQRWYDFTGGTFEELQGWGWEHFLHPDDLAPTLQRWQHSLATGEPFEGESRWRNHQGQYRWFLTRAECLRDKTGAITEWVGANTDVHEVKQVQEQLEAQNARLMRTNEDLDNFVYTASHDLKQPINNMAGIFEELTRTAYFRDPEAIKLISYFERALAQIFGTIDDLSAIVRGQRQQQEVPAETVALAPLVAEVINSLQDQVTQSGAAFELDFATCPAVTFVRPNLQSLLFNLISNSLKYAAPDRPPRIRLSSTPEAASGRPVLTVQDNGLGIDMERFGPQLFQLFRRFHTHVDGTGMGLYLVNRIVQIHGGRLEVTSTVGEGTTFLIYL
ncbi:PAS domain-containing protein [Hymenobacter sp. BT664]|uniref:histidine kinase n=1 Tax=Hymenobacter montanus TaxID=2771359 RepID=A0A927BCZ1_9BACT|nr:PAS domain-containing protein [Hymenobacter montanus]MBD2768516.1 PAS domain-containing protein [Hymenobacter montanus]